MDEIDEKVLKDYVEAEFKGQKFRFYPIPVGDVLEFSELLANQPMEILKEEDKLLNFISKSLRTDKKNIRRTVGFYMFALGNILEAIDFSFFIKYSGSLVKKLEEVRKEIEEFSPSSSQNLQDNSDGLQNTSKKTSP